MNKSDRFQTQMVAWTRRTGLSHGTRRIPADREMMLRSMTHPVVQTRAVQCQRVTVAWRISHRCGSGTTMPTSCSTSFFRARPSRPHAPLLRPGMALTKEAPPEASSNLRPPPKEAAPPSPHPSVEGIEIIKTTLGQRQERCPYSEGGRRQTRSSTEDVFARVFPGDELQAPMRVLRAASGVLLPLRGLSAFESDLQIPDGSHVRRLGHQQTPKSRFTTQCPWTSPNRMRLVEATQHKCRGRSAKISPNRDWKPRAGAPGCEERHRSYQLSRKHFQKVPIVGIPHALGIITVLT